MDLALPEPLEPGIWPDAWLVKAVESGIIEAPHFSESQYVAQCHTESKR